MKKIHLNYDGKQNNGIIFNDTYQGAMYLGAELKPDIGEPYDSFQYSEVFDSLNYVELDSVKKVMTPEQEAIIIGLATAWVQPEGQEGNPNLEQMKVTQKALITQASVDASNQPFEYMGTVFNGGESSARAVNDVVEMSEKSNVLLGSNITSVDITDIDDNKVSMSLEEAQILALRLANIVQTCFQDRQSKKVLIENATTKSEVTDIVW